MPSDHLTLTSVPGIKVGHAHDLVAATGCTVVLCPESTAAAVDVRGGAPGTRETDLLRSGRLVEHVDALVLAGGSAFGLAAADGVVRFLEERGRGFPTPAARVPIVPAAILYDLEVGGADVRPDGAMGYAACAAAGEGPVQRGSVGAGAGCSVGKLRRGAGQATKGGIGSAGARLGGAAVVAALYAVNAMGDVLDEEGRILAGLREAPDKSKFLGIARLVLGDSAVGRRDRGERQKLSPPSTVIGVVATNARLGRDQLTVVARMAHDGLACSLSPAHTLVDGDTVFAIATGALEADPLAVGVAAAEVTAAAVRDGVRQATSLGGVKALRDL